MAKVSGPLMSMDARGKFGGAAGAEFHGHGGDVAGDGAVGDERRAGLRIFDRADDRCGHEPQAPCLLIGGLDRSGEHPSLIVAWRHLGQVGGFAPGPLARAAG